MDATLLIARYPVVFHMAEAGSWSSVQANGLLSTKAVLDLMEVHGPARVELEAQHRPGSVVLNGAAGKFVLRDQKPMGEDRIRAALPPEISPSQWYAFINSRVFFWAEEHRLLRLLGAREYRSSSHDVLLVRTESLVRSYQEKMLLCHMNSGNTYPIPHRRDFGIFKTIADYPTRASGRPLKEVVEITVDYSVPDISDHVIAVREMRGPEVIREIYL